jgi:ring-1,2-phenylacetyl-CoA epoxidase subunit PaaC
VIAVPKAESAAAHFDYVLQLADACLILGQRLGENVGHAPALEEDLGLANTALDLIGQARLLLNHAGAIEGAGRDEDQLAFLRAESEFRNPTLVEMPNVDFGQIIVRQVLVDAWQMEVYERLQQSTDTRLAGIAAKSLKECRYHLRYSGGWLVRLGDGTEQSRSRAQSALERLWPFTAELFDERDSDRALHAAGIAPAQADIRRGWVARIDDILAESTLTKPAESRFRWQGRRGAHSEHLGYILAEMQYLQRSHPGAKW